MLGSELNFTAAFPFSRETLVATLQRRASGQPAVDKPPCKTNQGAGEMAP
jgi:hypothetical protein